MAEIRNIGIFAHVDAGKTTLSEQMLLCAGAIRQAGRVDNGTAHTDSLPVEQRRGISVKAKCVQLRWHDCLIRLIDTPGHTDFSAEIERSLWALDGAVLVISGAEGVQPQTELLYQALREQGVPVVMFVNKMDREGASLERTLREVRQRLCSAIVPLADAEAMAEAVCGMDDALMARYLEGEQIPAAELRQALAALTRRGAACPLLSGAALQGQGVDALLDAVAAYLPAPGTGSGRLCGVVFASEEHRVMGRGLWVRLYSGTLENRDSVEWPGRPDPLSGEARPVQRKITQIRAVDGTDLGRLQAGDIGVVYGLGDARVGQVLGEEALLPRRVSPGRLRTPLLRVQAVPAQPEQMEALREACMRLSAEDPLLQAQWSRFNGELQLQAMGTVQLEILREELQNRFGLQASFGKPSVLYHETIAKPAVGVVYYTMPKPCWAILHFLIEPGKPGSGVVYSSQVPVAKIMERYQHQVEQALPQALSQGRLGWPVTDVRITLVDGEHHLVHTHPLDFIVATPWGIQDGLARGGSVLLEPMLQVRFLLPADCLGRVMSDTALMRGEVTDTHADGERVYLTALLPAATSMDYPTQLASLSGGRASMSVRLHSYRPCPLELGATAPRRSVDPLDTARYILAARSALAEGIYDS